jgi:hypothetical protein
LAVAPVREWRLRAGRKRDAMLRGPKDEPLKIVVRCLSRSQRGRPAIPLRRSG